MATAADLFIFRSSLHFHLFSAFHSIAFHFSSLLSVLSLRLVRPVNASLGVSLCALFQAPLSIHILIDRLSLCSPDPSASPFMVCDSRHFPALQRQTY